MAAQHIPGAGESGREVPLVCGKIVAYCTCNINVRQPYCRYWIAALTGRNVADSEFFWAVVLHTQLAVTLHSKHSGRANCITAPARSSLCGRAASDMCRYVELLHRQEI